MCESCKSTAKCPFCDGSGSIYKGQTRGQITSYANEACGACFGSGLCVACQGHKPADELDRKDAA
jgi:hypothetical protein